MATVIDSLLISLGLDAGPYKRGRQQAEKETAELTRKVKSGADDITKSLAEVGKTVASLFLGFESATGLTKWLGGLNAGEAALGRTATSLGINVHELNRYELAAKLAGQSGADVAAAFQTLTAGATKFLSGQGTSPIMDLLRNAGVSAVDASSKIRNQGEVFEELARKTAKWGTQLQGQRFRDAGIAEGEINYLLQSNSLREDQLRLAEKNNNVTADSVLEAQRLQEYWANIGIQIESAGQKILLSITPYVKDAFTWVSNLMAAFKDDGGLTAVSGVIGTIGNGVRAIFNGWKLIIDMLNNSTIFKSWDKYVSWFTGLLSKGLAIGAGATPTGAAPTAATPNVSPDRGIGYTPPAKSKAARFNNPGNILDTAGNERQYASLEEGGAALEKDLAIKMKRGLKTVDAIINAYEGGDNVHNNIPAYIADVRKRLGKNELNESDIKELARAISIHENGPGVQSGPTPGLASANKGTAQVASNTTTVSVGTIQVNAPNADPRAVAEQIPAAVQRKLSVSQALQGQS